MKEKKILILRFSSIGDIVLTTPLLRCLKTQLPDIEIHYLTKTAFAPIIKANPYVQKVYSFNKSLKEVLPDIIKENYSFVADLHRNIRTAIVKTALMAPSRSFPKLNLHKWLYVRFKINFMPDVHIVDRYFKTLKAFSVTYDTKGLDFFIPADEEINTKILYGINEGEYFAAVIGGKHETKILPPEVLAEVFNSLDKPLILLGAEEDYKRGELVKRLSNTIVHNACGKHTLFGSASLIRQSAAVLSNDTGLMHIAAALKKNIVSVWGNTVPEFGMYPYLPEDLNKSYTIIENNKLKCRPCSKIGFENCPKGHFRCMRDLNTEQIARAILNSSH